MSTIFDVIVLHKVAKSINLEKYVQWGKGEAAQKDWLISNRPLAECFEALIGAIYLDGGMEEAKLVFWKFFD